MIEEMHRLVIHSADFDPISDACGVIIDLKRFDMARRILVVSKLLTHRPMIERLAKDSDFRLDVRSASRKRKNDKPTLAVNVDAVLVHPEVVGKILMDASKKFFDTLIVVQGYDFKNPRAARFTAVRRRLMEFNRRYVYLCGAQNLMDLWAPAFFVDVGKSLGKYRAEFYNRYCEPHGFQGREWRVRDTAVGELKAAIAPMTTFVPETSP